VILWRNGRDEQRECAFPRRPTHVVWGVEATQLVLEEGLSDIPPWSQIWNPRRVLHRREGRGRQTSRASQRERHRCGRSRQGRRPLELEPLYSVVDPDALFRQSGESSAAVTLHFTMEGCEVVVHNDGEVLVVPPWNWKTVPLRSWFRTETTVRQSPPHGHDARRGVSGWVETSLESSTVRCTVVRRLKVEFGRILIRFRRKIVVRRLVWWGHVFRTCWDTGRWGRIDGSG